MLEIWVCITHGILLATKVIRSMSKMVIIVRLLSTIPIRTGSRCD